MGGGLAVIWLTACGAPTTDASNPSTRRPTQTVSAPTSVSYIQNLSARQKLSLNGQWARIVDPYENGYYNYRAHSIEDARATLTLAQELGANFVRLAHYPHNEAMIRMADELGLMVWSEIPVYWTVLFDNPQV